MASSKDYLQFYKTIIQKKKSGVKPLFCLADKTVSFPTTIPDSARQTHQREAHPPVPAADG